ncbi:hypothetical protein Ahy_A09g045409 [Arachis hypogaea]|uniref:Uncharacterized protein n=1 Tax=Arachis hypogaea TaxID=3818 RepID=A0A445BMA3_ARAHY|nr:hypothetical protein Ahy_A09g045409 [Arachis hypogaea]
MCAKMSRSRIQIKILPVYHESDEMNGVRVLHRVLWSFYPCIITFIYTLHVMTCHHVIHIGSNFLRRFKTPYLHKFVVNISYSTMEQEYKKTTKDSNNGVRHILNDAMRSVLRNGCWHLMRVIIGVI